MQDKRENGSFDKKGVHPPTLLSHNPSYIPIEKACWELK